MGVGTGTEQWLLTATLGGQPIGVWDASTGGDGDSETRSYRRGDGALIPRGGPPTFDELTISRIWDNDRANFLQWMHSRGKSGMTVTHTERDQDGNPVASGITYTGTLKKVTKGEPNSNESGDVMVTLTMNVTGIA